MVMKVNSNDFESGLVVGADGLAWSVSETADLLILYYKQLWLL